MLLWRSLLQWIGGTGVILVFTILLPAIGVTGKSLLDSEAVGVARQDQRPRVREQAKQLFRLYVALTALACLALLCLVAIAAAGLVCVVYWRCVGEMGELIAWDD